MKKTLNIKKLILLNMPYILLGLFATNFGEAWRMAQGTDASEKFLSLIAVLPGALESFWPSLHPLDLLVGLCCGGSLRLAVYLKSKNAKKYRHGLEYGSARWGSREDIAPYVDPVFQNNVILTKTESLTMNSRPKDPKTARNKNVLVIGGSGSGKTRFWLKPNLMQMHSSYVVTDPKGTILVECGKMLQRGAPKLGKDGKPMKDKHGKVIYEPYRIKVLNTINFKKSMHYNPFAYIHSEKDILKLVTTLIANTKGEGKAGDDFWVKAETLLYCALIGYIHYEAPVEEQNFSTLIEFINAMEVREDDEEFKNPVDLMFDALESEKPNHFAVRQYKKYKLAAGKTAKSILISCGARLAVFDIAELREVTSYDELELDTLGDRKTALFLIMSDTDDSFNFLISMCYTQLFNLLCEKADDVYGGRLDAYLWQTVENKQKFISQIMTSKSPVRSCDDVDETALSFAEIKALCAGDPRIKERMDLDVEVSRLKLMKADHQSKQYRLEDQLLKYFPEEIEKHKGFIKGFESDLEVLAAHPHPEDGFAGMEIRGDLLTDKENAGAALLDACKEVKTSDPVQIGSYRGYAISVEFSAWKQEYTLLLKGQMTHRATLGTDPRGNLTRIDNALAQMPQRLEAAKAQLDNLYQQQAAAKEEVGKPFLYEEELRSKNARLVELDTLLNIDGKGQAHAEAVVTKSARPSVLDHLKRPATPRSTDKKPKQHEEVR